MRALGLLSARLLGKDRPGRDVGRLKMGDTSDAWRSGVVMIAAMYVGLVVVVAEVKFWKVVSKRVWV